MVDKVSIQEVLFTGQGLMSLDLDAGVQGHMSPL